MYQELSPLLNKLQTDIRAKLAVVSCDVDQPRLLAAYMEQLVLPVGADVANETITAVAIDQGGQMLTSLEGFANAPAGFTRFRAWVERTKAEHGAQVVVVGSECTGVYHEEFWRYLGQQTDYARVLFNPRTTEHMAEVLSVRVRDDLTDAYLIAQQLRLGSTRESRLRQDERRLAARECARIVRNIAKSTTRKKTQLKAIVRTFNPALYRTFPQAQFYSLACKALLRHYLFPEEILRLDQTSLAAFLNQHSRRHRGETIAKALLQDTQNCFGKTGSRPVIRQRVHDLLDDIDTLQQRRRLYLQLGYQQIADRPETALLRAIPGCGISITLALVSEIGDVSRLANGEQLASFLGLTTCKHISGTSLYVSKHITKQGSPVARYAAVKLADGLRKAVPKYQAMYQRIHSRKPPRKGHFIALVAIARDFVSNVLFDMLANQRPFFIEIEDYRAYRRRQQI